MATITWPGRASMHMNLGIHGDNSRYSAKLDNDLTPLTVVKVTGETTVGAHGKVFTVDKAGVVERGAGPYFLLIPNMVEEKKIPHVMTAFVNVPLPVTYSAGDVADIADGRIDVYTKTEYLDTTVDWSTVSPMALLYTNSDGKITTTVPDSGTYPNARPIGYFVGYNEGFVELVIKLEDNL